MQVAWDSQRLYVALVDHVVDWEAMSFAATARDDPARAPRTGRHSSAHRQTPPPRELWRTAPATRRGPASPSESTRRPFEAEKEKLRRADTGRHRSARERAKASVATCSTDT